MAREVVIKIEDDQPYCHNEGCRFAVPGGVGCEAVETCEAWYSDEEGRT